MQIVTSAVRECCLDLCQGGAPSASAKFIFVWNTGCFSSTLMHRVCVLLEHALCPSRGDLIKLLLRGRERYGRTVRWRTRVPKGFWSQIFNLQLREKCTTSMSHGTNVAGVSSGPASQRHTFGNVVFQESLQNKRGIARQVRLLDLLLREAVDSALSWMYIPRLAGDIAPGISEPQDGCAAIVSFLSLVVHLAPPLLPNGSLMLESRRVTKRPTFLYRLMVLVLPHGALTSRMLLVEKKPLDPSGGHAEHAGREARSGAVDNRGSTVRLDEGKAG